VNLPSSLFSKSELTLSIAGEPDRAFDLRKPYHSTDSYYVDVESSADNLRVTLHPKVEGLRLAAASLRLPLASGIHLQQRGDQASYSYLARYVAKHLSLTPELLSNSAEPLHSCLLTAASANDFRLCNRREDVALSSFSADASQLTIKKFVSNFSLRHSLEL